MSRQMPKFWKEYQFDGSNWIEKCISTEPDSMRIFRTSLKIHTFSPLSQRWQWKIELPAKRKTNARTHNFTISMPLSLHIWLTYCSPMASTASNKMLLHSINFVLISDSRKLFHNFRLLYAMHIAPVHPTQKAPMVIKVCSSAIRCFKQ